METTRRTFFLPRNNAMPLLDTPSLGQVSCQIQPPILSNVLRIRFSHPHVIQVQLIHRVNPRWKPEQAIQHVPFPVESHTSREKPHGP